MLSNDKIIVSYVLFMYLYVELQPVQFYTVFMTIIKSTPEHPGNDEQEGTITADYHDGLRILAHLIARKYLQNQHSNINLQGSEGEAHGRDEIKS
jgi:hypothetical protein